MKTCDRIDCGFNHGGVCESGNPAPDNEENCPNYYDPWDYMDDIEREEFMRSYEDSEGENE